MPFLALSRSATLAVALFLTSSFVAMTEPAAAQDDPAPVTVGQETMLFVTTQPGRAIGLATGTPFVLQREWTGVSVPHAMVVGREVWLWAQTVRDGRMIPVLSKSADAGQQWSDWSAPLPLEGLDGCGNPVGAVFQGAPVVFCVSEPLRFRPQ